MADDLRAVDFELGLPSPSDLTPLSQSLITPELASAFGIIPDPSRIFLDLNKASHATYSMICPKEDNFEPPLKLFPSKNDCDENLDEPGSNRAVKRPRLVWTPQLHKRFVDVIEHLGIEKAVPKTIMEMMNVEGLTRENVASHLQKYRLYLKRNEGVVTSHDGHSTSTPTRGSSFLECCDSVSLMMPLPMMGQGNGGFGFRPLGMSVGDSVNSGLFWN